jgi:hypothetical protein
LRNRVEANSKMRLSIFLTVLIVVLALTRPNTINCRVHPFQVKTIDEPIKGLKFQIMKEKANNVFRVLIGNQVHTMSSGPSEKGPGH